MLKRQKQVTVRFTEEEYHQLKNKCDAAGMKMEPFLRALVSGCTIRERPPDSYKALAAQVAAVGNNLNQLTRLANSTGKIEKDVITYLKKRQSQPEKFSAPTGYYSASWNKGGKPKMLTLREWANLDTAKSRKKFQDFLTLKMQPYSDVLSVAEASRLTGYHHNTLTNWCHNGYIRYFEISGGYMIPKSCLLNFLLSPHILDSYRPSKKLVDLAKEFSRQGKSTKKPTAK